MKGTYVEIRDFDILFVSTWREINVFFFDASKLTKIEVSGPTEVCRDERNSELARR